MTAGHIVPLHQRHGVVLRRSLKLDLTDFDIRTGFRVLDQLQHRAFEHKKYISLFLIFL